MNRAAKRNHFNRAILATDAIGFLKLMRQTLGAEGVGKFSRYRDEYRGVYASY
jgi:hypothetical protein